MRERGSNERRRAGSPRTAAILEALEGRTLLTVFAPFDIFAEQALLYDIGAPAGSYGFGAAVASLGDVDGDGRADFAIGAPGRAPDATGGPIAGSVFVYSGATGTLLRTFSDGAAGFGAAIAGVGDVNGDGAADLAVGSPEFADTTGSVGRLWVYSGLDGSMLYAVAGDGPQGALGRAVVGVRDVDGDGRPDIAVGGREGEQGEVRIISGATGSLLSLFAAGAANASFGSVLAPIDGPRQDFPVIAVGAPDDGVGAVYVFNGDGTAGPVLRSSGAAVHGFGSSIASVFFAAGSPFPFNEAVLAVVSRPGDGVTTFDGGRVEFWRTWPEGAQVLRDTFEPPAGGRLGSTIVVGDLRSQVRAFVIRYTDGAGAAQADVVRIENNRDIVVTRQIGSGKHVSMLTGSAALTGDLDLDGRAEFITGAPALGGRVTVLRTGPLFAGRSDGVTRDASAAWQVGVSDPRLTPRPLDGYFLINGRWLAWENVPGSEFAGGIVDMAGTSLIVGHAHDGVLVVRDGVRSTLASLITSMQGGNVDVDKLLPVRALPDGRIVLTTRGVGPPVGDTAWILGTDGVLTLLWFGVAGDANRAGTVVGTLIDVDGTPHGVRWDSGVVSLIPGMSGAQAIDSAGNIAGWAPGSRLVVFRNGVLSDLGVVDGALGDYGSSGPPMGTVTSTFDVYRVTPEQRVLGWLYVTGTSSEGFTLTWRFEFYTDPATPLTTRLFTIPPTYWKFPTDSLNRPSTKGLSDSGVLLSNLGEWRAKPDSVLNTARPGESVAVWTDGDQVRFSTVNQFGLPVSFSLANAAWSSRSGPTLVLADPALGELVTWVDPVDGETYAIFSGKTSYHWLVMVRGLSSTPRIWTIRYANGTHYTPVLHSLTPFTSTDGRFHVMGIDDAGNIQVLSRTDKPTTDGNAWALSQVSRDDLAFQGIATPAWVSRPVAYVTPWNGFNIAGLDAAGHVQVLWIAPGMRFWRVDDLSQIASAPRLVGGITGFSTAWGAMNVAGVDEQGELVTLWWAPGMTDWVSSNLSENAGSGVRLRADTLTSYVAPWGGLNIAGIDENGEVTAFWWAPGLGGWVATSLTGHLSPSTARPAGPLRAVVTAAGAFHVGGVSAAGHVLDLTWKPGGVWTIDDVTVLAG